MYYELKNSMSDKTKEIKSIFNIKIPISNISKVVEKMGGQIVEDPSISSCANCKIIKDGKYRFIIKIPINLNNYEKNFVVIYNIGHIFLHLGFTTNRWYDYKTSFTKKEKAEANDFAMCFLLPKRDFLRVALSYERVINVYEIAKLFKVPIEVVVYRCRQLDLFN